jgi:hypothetical protein
MSFIKNYNEFVSESKINESDSHEGWLVIGFDTKTKEAEILSIPLIKKEAIRFLQNFEVQMSKMSDKLRKYSKLKLAHASEVFEGSVFEHEGDAYTVYESFDFEDYEDTDVNGMTQEVDIDNLIEEHISFVKKDIPKNEWQSAWSEIKRLWIDKIKSSKI